MKKQLLSIFSILTIGCAFAQIPNNGFESWGTSMGEPVQPLGYVSENVIVISFFPGNTASVTQATGVDAFAGTYAAKITTVKVNNNPAPTTIPDTIGLLMLGQVNMSPVGLKSGVGWTTRLQSINFNYKYAPVNGDNGVVMAYLTKHVSNNIRDTLATAAFGMTSTVSAYTAASAPFVYDGAFPASTLPDSLHLYYLSSARPWLNTTLLPSNPQIGSVLWVDEATAVVGINEKISLMPKTKVYPNPATNYINISSINEEAISAELFDVTGNKVSTGLFYDNKVRIETSDLAEGLYIYSVKNKDKKVIATGKVNVTK
ncbi:MAG: T9SS type A sorting domain-containing protein [Bacteroidota bacterium]|nr:T9SS type A sorting domain-containing protein [Bacteroidota bacterium]